MRTSRPCRLILYRGLWHAYRWHEDRAWRISLRTANRAIAERRLADLVGEAQRPAITVGDVMEAYLARRYGSRTDNPARYAWRNLAPHFHSKRPSNVGRESAEQYVVFRRHMGSSDGTIIRELGVLRAALRHAGHDFPRGVLPGSPPPRERYLTRGEVDRLIEAARPTPHLFLFLTLAYATAARRGALLELQWKNVDLRTGTIDLRAGSDDRRRLKPRARVPMSSDARRALEAARPLAMSPFVIEWGGQPVRSIKTAFARATSAAGLAGTTVHMIRHSASVHMSEAGVDLAVIAKYLGHSDVRTTFRVYLKYSPGYLAEGAAALTRKA